eukprot:Stramenopile-MAST_4_protein_2206
MIFRPAAVVPTAPNGKKLSGVSGTRKNDSKPKKPKRMTKAELRLTNSEIYRVNQKASKYGPLYAEQIVAYIQGKSPNPGPFPEFVVYEGKSVASVLAAKDPVGSDPRNPRIKDCELPLTDQNFFLLCRTLNFTNMLPEYSKSAFGGHCDRILVEILTTFKRRDQQKKFLSILTDLRSGKYDKGDEVSSEFLEVVGRALRMASSLEGKVDLKRHFMLRIVPALPFEPSKRYLWAWQEVFILDAGGGYGRVRRARVTADGKHFKLSDGTLMPSSLFTGLKTEARKKPGPKPAVAPPTQFVRTDCDASAEPSWEYEKSWTFANDERTCDRFFQARLSLVEAEMALQVALDADRTRFLKYLQREYPIRRNVDEPTLYLRSQCIGVDRFHNRYWHFIRRASDAYLTSYLFVEVSELGLKHYDERLGSSTHSTYKTLSAGAWLCVTGKRMLDRLILSLLQDGPRERELLHALVKRYNAIVASHDELGARASYLSNAVPFAPREEDGKVMDINVPVDSDGHVGVTFKSIVWHYNGTTFVEAVETAEGSPLKCLKPGDMVIAVGKQSTAGMTVAEVAKAFVGCLSGSDDRHVPVRVFRWKIPICITSRPCTMGMPILIHGDATLVHAQLLRCEAVAWALFQRKEATVIRHQWLWLHGVGSSWLWPTSRVKWRQRLADACRSGKYLTCAEMNEMVLLMEDAYMSLLPPVHPSFAMEDLLSAFENMVDDTCIPRAIGRGKVGQGQQLLLGIFGGSLDFSGNPLPSVMELQKEMESNNVRTYRDLGLVIEALCSEFARRLGNAVLLQGKLRSLETISDADKDACTHEALNLFVHTHARPYENDRVYPSALRGVKKVGNRHNTQHYVEIAFVGEESVGVKKGPFSTQLECALAHDAAVRDVYGFDGARKKKLTNFSYSTYMNWLPILAFRERGCLDYPPLTFNNQPSIVSVCPVCGRHSASKTALQHHVQKHHAVLRPQPLYSVSAAFLPAASRLVSRQSSWNTPTGRGGGSSVFSKSGALKKKPGPKPGSKHPRKKPGPKPKFITEQHKCPECSVPLGSADSLRRHIRTMHSNEARIEMPCPHCTAVLGSNDSFRRHLRVLHPTVQPTKGASNRKLQ